MAYNPSLYNPYGTQQFQPTISYPQQFQPTMQQQPVNGLVRIEGIEGAQMYQMPTNSVSPPLFLGNEAAFFIKTTDGGGAATLKKYSFKEEPLEPVSNDYVTKADFNAFAQEIREAINGKPVVPEPAAE